MGMMKLSHDLRIPVGLPSVRTASAVLGATILMPESKITITMIRRISQMGIEQCNYKLKYYFIL